MPTSFDITRILSLGTIGLGFLLAFLAFRLLSKEQSMTKPREGILRATNRFMIFSLVLCFIGLSSELYRVYRGPTTTPPAQIQGAGYFNLDPAEMQAVIKESEDFLGKIAAGDYRVAYDSTSQLMRNSFSFTDFQSQNTLMKNAFGAHRERKFASALKGLGPSPNGGTSLFYYVIFHSSYERMALASDTLVLVKNDDGAFKIVNINVR